MANTDEVDRLRLFRAIRDLGVEAGDRSSNFETCDRICKFYGWPQTFAVH